MHITRLSPRPEVTKLGLSRVKRLTELAEKEKVFLALENLDSIQRLDYIFNEISSKYLGFCYCSHMMAASAGMRWRKNCAAARPFEI